LRAGVGDPLRGLQGLFEPTPALIRRKDAALLADVCERLRPGLDQVARGDLSAETVVRGDVPEADALVVDVRVDGEDRNLRGAVPFDRPDESRDVGWCDDQEVRLRGE